MYVAIDEIVTSIIVTYKRGDILTARMPEFRKLTVILGDVIVQASDYFGSPTVQRGIELADSAVDALRGLINQLPRASTDTGVLRDSLIALKDIISSSNSAR